MSFLAMHRSQRLESNTKKITGYYVNDSIVPFEEDQNHEFKGHRNLTDEELPHWAFIHETSRRSRKGISRNINGFLNTGTGGTIYIGILDDGRVNGLMLTQFQKDHLVAAVDDVMSSYKPEVLKHRYKVKFVPTVSADCGEEELKAIVSFDSSITVDIQSRQRAHTLRQMTYCWCEKDAVQQINCGLLPPRYVIEIVLKPWNPADPLNNPGRKSFICNLHPLHEDDDGKCYFRRLASTVPLMIDEIYTLSRSDAALYFQDQIRQLSEEINRVRVTNEKTAGTPDTNN